MSGTGPVLIGAGFQRNVTSLAVSVGSAGGGAVPAGAFIILCLGTNAPDTATIAVSDSAGNVYSQQIGSQQPGTTASLFVLLTSPLQTKALSAGQTITVTSSSRADLGVSAYYFTGVAGSLHGSDVEWNNSAAPLFAGVNALFGDTMFATLGVGGPSSDTFTQDSAWGADVKANIATTTFTVHSCSRAATVQADGFTLYNWAPTLSAARQSVGALLSFN